MRLGGHALDLLRGIRRGRRDDRVQLGEGGDGAVEMALAVAEAAAAPVEGGERHEQRDREALRRVGAGLAHAEAAPDERVARAPQRASSVGCRICDSATVLAALHEPRA